MWPGIIEDSQPLNDVSFHPLSQFRRRVLIMGNPLPESLLGLEPIWVNREEALTPLLVFSLGVGAAHVLLGLLLGVWGAARAANRTQLAERTALLVAMIGMFLIVGAVADRLPSGFVTPGVAALIVGLAVMMAWFRYSQQSWKGRGTSLRLSPVTQ